MNTVIKAYSQSSNPGNAVELYFEMLRRGFLPNSYTFPPLVSLCAKKGCADDGEKCHGQAVKNGVDAVVHVRNALVHMYANCGLVGCARQVFDAMPVRDLVSWNSIGDGYAKMGDLVSARSLFDVMPERNVVSWNVMLVRYLRGGNLGCGLKLFREMGRVGMRSSPTTMVSAVTACGRSARLKEGRSVHWFWVKNFVEPSLTEGAINATFVEAIRPHVLALWSSPYGKKVLSSNNPKK
ncbi:pentatricopeptide repeat-containing protein At3g51320-like [Magnolia sinica]|uniref:pentatricopeptide repeat-containing protein At3g51320-like n=1 Tax=Magnolia sinica TaxID=86752 RepID=UPI00265A34DE|nr:pentatricopeptide repeat-containing protein At3g51320-like [Magnolia sinica]